MYSLLFVTQLNEKPIEAYLLSKGMDIKFYIKRWEYDGDYGNQ